MGGVGGVVARHVTLIKLGHSSNAQKPRDVSEAGSVTLVNA